MDKFKVLDIVTNALEGSDKFLVNMKITPDNRIFVDIDGDNGINIDDCIELHRHIENQLDREEEDYELNVSSAGADSPLKLPRQYTRHIGRTLIVDTLAGENIEGILTEADGQQFTLRIAGKKKTAPQERTFAYGDTKSVHVVITF